MLSPAGILPKQLIVRPVKANKANNLCRRWHYSGKVVPNSQLHFGVFWRDKCYGVMQFGPSLRKEFLINMVKGTPWNGFLELNRMAFSELLPKNSESRCLAVALKLIKKHYQHIKWVVSFADATQSGDGCIYRAVGFKLVNIKKNAGLKRNKHTGEVMQQMQAYHKCIQNTPAWVEDWEPLPGFMLCYVYFLDPDFKANLQRGILSYDVIQKKGAGMYRGQKRAI